MNTTTQDKALLRSAVGHYIALDCSNVIDPATKDQMVNSIVNLIIDLSHKFVKGQLEHGGKITDRDLKIEVRQEMLDLFWYLEAQGWKK